VTYTYAILDVPTAVYADLRERLVEVSYEHTFHKQDGAEVIDMHGIALRACPGLDPPPSRRYPGIKSKS
jgi:hypothetical protein